MKKILISIMVLLGIGVNGTKFTENNKENVITVDTTNYSKIVSNVKAAILMEVDSKKVLYSLNENEKRTPASMTKIMTMKLVLDQINNNKLSMDEIVTTSEYASKMGGSQIFLSPNEKMKVNDLFKSMVIASANDAAVSLAERISGSEENFVKMMNLEASKLGCKNTNFVNATGLPTTNHYTTCYDLGLIACELLSSYSKDVIPYSSTYEDYVRKDTANPFWLVNTNKLIKSNIGIDGLKTGWTVEAGYCLTATMEKNGMRLVSVVMGAESPTLRNQDTITLLNYGFDNYEKVTVLNQDEVIEKNELVTLDPNKYSIVASKSVSYVKFKNDELKKVTYKYKINYYDISNLKTKNIGTVEVYLDDECYSIAQLEVKEKLSKESFIEVILNLLKTIF